MNAMWRQILVGSAAAAVLVGLGVLEVRRDRMTPGDEASAAAPSLEAERPSQWQGFLISQGDLLSLELGPPADWDTRGPASARSLTAAVQADRMTLLQVEPNARRIVWVSNDGRVRRDEVATEAVVVSDDRKASDLAVLNPGDLIKIEPRGGQIQKIVVLRHAWHETMSPEQ